MTGRLFAALCSLLVAGLCALSLGGRIFYLVSWALMLMLFYALLSVLMSRSLLRIGQQIAERKVERGQSSRLRLTIRNLSPLPVAPLEVRLSLPGGKGSSQIEGGCLREKEASFPFALPHVGLIPVGLSALYICDIFGLIRVPGKRMEKPGMVTVLPRPFEVDKLKFLVREDGRALPNRSSEDITSPEDTRAWREGDPLKSCTGS